MPARKRVNVAAVLAAHSPMSVAERYGIQIHKSGARYHCACFIHEDRDPSMVLYQDHAYCYGCGWWGDSIAMVASLEGLTFPEAAKKLTENDGDFSIASRQNVPRDTRDDLTPIVPVPADAPDIEPGCETPLIWNPNKGRSSRWNNLEAVYWYYTPDGERLGCVIRAKTKAGKLTPQVMWCERNGKQTWALTSFPRPRPLYWAERDATLPTLVVEGEKAANAAATLLGDLYRVVTWPGGTKAVRYANWEELRGTANVLLWPDADEGGYEAMGALGAILEPLVGDGIRVVLTMDRADVVKGWDLADALEDGATAEQILQRARKNVQPWGEAAQLLSPIRETHPPLEDAASQTPLRARKEEPGDSKPSDAVETGSDDALPPPPGRTTALSKEDHSTYAKHWLFLGYDEKGYHYLPRRTQQPKCLSARDHMKHHLMELAPRSWWAVEFGTEAGGISWERAEDWMFRCSAKSGLYDPERIRGRGAWLEKGGPVFHTGSGVWSRGERLQLNTANKGDHLYPRRHDLGIALNDPLPTYMSAEILKLMTELSWESPLSAFLLTGWCVIAPICGALDWRPHIWITGESGSGKTTVMRMVSALLGPSALTAEMGTTEAGIRQTLKDDALPIIFDEAEAEDQRAQGKMRGVLDLVRMASSGGTVRKGTVSGNAQSYTMRSCWAFSSINPNIKLAADVNRISQIILRTRIGSDSQEWFEDYVARTSLMLTPDFSARMLARSVQNIPLLRDIIDYFIAVVAAKLSNRRLADQVGTLLAGAYSCCHEGKVTLQMVRDWVDQLSWVPQPALAMVDDKAQLLQLLLGKTRGFSTAKGRYEMTLGELTSIVVECRIDIDTGMNRIDANKILGRFGMKVLDSGDLIIANSSPGLKELLVGTPWVHGWARTLRGLEGASAHEKVEYFAGTSSRATKIPQTTWMHTPGGD